MSFQREERFHAGDELLFSKKSVKTTAVEGGIKSTPTNWGRNGFLIDCVHFSIRRATTFGATNPSDYGRERLVSFLQIASCLRHPAAALASIVLYLCVGLALVLVIQLIWLSVPQLVICVFNPKFPRNGLISILFTCWTLLALYSLV